MTLTLRFDHSSKGKLSVREWLNVIKIQNKVDISLASVRLVYTPRRSILVNQSAEKDLRET